MKSAQAIQSACSAWCRDSSQCRNHACATARRGRRLSAKPFDRRSQNAGRTHMPDLVGEAVDRLVTIEAKNRGMPHGVLQPMYEAARKAAGGRPLTMLAAEGLKRTLGRGDVV